MTGIFRGFPLLLVRLFWFRMGVNGHLEDGLWICHGLWKRYGLCLALLIEDVSGLDWLQCLLHISLDRVHQLNQNGRIVTMQCCIVNTTENGNEGQPHLTALSPKPQLAPETSFFAGRMAFHGFRM